MLADFDDFSSYVCVINDDLYQQLSPFVSHPGPAPRCSDSELSALYLNSECKGWDIETELLSNMRAYPGLFPIYPNRVISTDGGAG